MGNNEIGFVTAYDPDSMTATIMSSDGATHYRNVGTLLQSCDYAGGSYSFNPPVVGSPCLYTVIRGEAYILGYYLPPNMSGGQATPGFGDTIGKDSTIESTTGAVINRSPGDFPNRSSLPGDSVQTGKMGAEVSFRDTMFNIKMSPTFYSIWNMLNKFFDMICNKLRFRSPACDVSVDIADDQATNVNITVRQGIGERTGTPAINLNLGSPSHVEGAVGVIDLKINGQPFLTVDLERNVVLNLKTMRVTGEHVDMTDVALVDLPF